MEVTFFSTRPYDRRFFEEANARHRHRLVFFEERLSRRTARLADSSPAICAFVNDVVDAEVLEVLAAQGTGLVALRSAGFNNVDLAAAERLGVVVARVPAYSPHAVAEHTVALILCLDRRLHRAYARVREGNFALTGLLGFDLHGRTVGVVGTGRIGEHVARILAGFGCRLLVHDPYENPAVTALGARYVELDELYAGSDIVTLHCPLTPETRGLVDASAVARMKRGAMLVNTSRGRLVDTRAVIDGLKSGRIGSLALDVYEEEEKLFFEDLSDTVIEDDVFARLLTFPNVLVTAHQGFFTEEALANIAETTLTNVDDFAAGRALGNAVTSSRVAPHEEARADGPGAPP